VTHHVLEVLPAELVAQVQPQRRRLDADVRVEPAALERVDRLAVGAGDPAGLVRIRDLLAEDVEGRELALGIQLVHHQQRVIQLFAGDVALRDPPHDRLRHRRQQANDGGVDEGHTRGGF
jgi:hypothetical protein